MLIPKSELLKEITFKTSRSGGKGGQNVNKVSSKVELLLDIGSSSVFSTEEKEQLKQKLHNKLIGGSVLQIITEEQRSQLANKERGIKKLFELLERALQKELPRKPTRPGKASRERRLKSKQLQSLKKINRQKNWID